MISFCTVCKGRLWQLRQTIFKNLSMLQDDCEMVLLDYQSDDGLEDFIRSNFSEELKSGKLKVFKLLHDYNYTSSYAKNVVHRLATGDILFNLDGDNFIQEGLIETLRNLPENTLLNAQGADVVKDIGSFGRLGYHKTMFDKLCGYNEDLVGMCLADDGDLCKRALLSGMRLKSILTPLDHIQNTDEDRHKYTNVDTLTNPPVDYPNQWGVGNVESYVKPEV